ncbi:hypothetical protein H9P43_006217 [Blastocladiella emersonii ATCC 22665]|nr:hypothetical protein H9P43_006217 [Blastocladiella emersonii ATCC 22665]
MSAPTKTPGSAIDAGEDHGAAWLPGQDNAAAANPPITEQYAGTNLTDEQIGTIENRGRTSAIRELWGHTFFDWYPLVTLVLIVASVLADYIPLATGLIQVATLGTLATHVYRLPQTTTRLSITLRRRIDRTTKIFLATVGVAVTTAATARFWEAALKYQQSVLPPLAPGVKATTANHLLLNGLRSEVSFNATAREMLPGVHCAIEIAGMLAWAAWMLVAGRQWSAHPELSTGRRAGNAATVTTAGTVVGTTLAFAATLIYVAASAPVTMLQPSRSAPGGDLIDYLHLSRLGAHAVAAIVFAVASARGAVPWGTAAAAGLTVVAPILVDIASPLTRTGLPPMVLDMGVLVSSIASAALTVWCLYLLTAPLRAAAAAAGMPGSGIQSLHRPSVSKFQPTAQTRAYQNGSASQAANDASVPFARRGSDASLINGSAGPPNGRGGHMASSPAFQGGAAGRANSFVSPHTGSFYGSGSGAPPMSAGSGYYGGNGVGYNSNGGPGSNFSGNNGPSSNNFNGNGPSNNFNSNNGPSNNFNGNGSSNSNFNNINGPSGMSSGGGGNNFLPNGPGGPGPNSSYMGNGGPGSNNTNSFMGNGGPGPNNTNSFMGPGPNRGNGNTMSFMSPALAAIVNNGNNGPGARPPSILPPAGSLPAPVPPTTLGRRGSTTDGVDFSLPAATPTYSQFGSGSDLPPPATNRYSHLPPMPPPVPAATAHVPTARRGSSPELLIPLSRIGTPVNGSVASGSPPGSTGRRPSLPAHLTSTPPRRGSITPLSIAIPPAIHTGAVPTNGPSGSGGNNADLLALSATAAAVMARIESRLSEMPSTASGSARGSSSNPDDAVLLDDVDAESAVGTTTTPQPASSVVSARTLYHGGTPTSGEPVVPFGLLAARYLAPGARPMSSVYELPPESIAGGGAGVTLDRSVAEESLASGYERMDSLDRQSMPWMQPGLFALRGVGAGGASPTASEAMSGVEFANGPSMSTRTSPK